jgi:hypothetical protein
MNVNFDFTVVTAFARRVLTELRENRLWPLAVGLVVAIAAVPFILTNSASPSPVAQAPQGTPPASQATSLPAIDVQTTPSNSRLTGRGRDPFAQQASGSSPTTSTTTATASSSATAGVAGSAATTGSTVPRITGAGAGTGATVTPPTATSTTPPSITESSKPTPTLAILKPTQSYHVTLAITNSSGGLDTIDPLERLSVLPSDQQPLLVELGVLQGGKRALFVVEPGTIVSGPGVCTPGPIDCEILSLAQDQTEGISSNSGNGVVQGPLFAITGITADNYSSVAAADKARQAESAAGRALVDKSTLSALSLFRYEPNVGAIVDLRNLTVGGN